MSVYVILNPAADYAAQMVQFLGHYEYQAIAVFTRQGELDALHGMWSDEDLANIADEFLTTDFPDLEALAEKILGDWPAEMLKGIIPWGEVDIKTGAELGELLELDWNPLEVIHRFRNKFALKAFLRDHTDIRVNASRIVSEEIEALEFCEEVGRWPIVVKPTEGAGSHGVYFANDVDELIPYCLETFETGQGEVLLEEYVGGREYVVNGITNAQGDVLITEVWRYDKRDSHGQKNLYFQTIKVDRSAPVFEIAANYAGQVIEALELRKSPFHMEIKVDDEGPCLIECGARFAGGNQPMLASMLHEHSLFELAACHYVEDLPFSIDDVHYDLYDQHQARIVKGVQSWEIPEISEVQGLEEIEALPSFYMIGFIKPVGSYLPVTHDMYTASYEVYLLHEDPDQIEADAESVRELLQYA